MAGEILLRASPGDPAGEYLRWALKAQGLTLTEDPEGLAACGGLVLSALTPRDVLRAAAGQGTLFDALWAGLPAWAPREGWPGVPDTPLGRRVEAALELLMDSGLTLCSLGELARRVKLGGTPRVRLLTARQVEAAGPMGRVGLRRGGVITPLALDRARTYRVTVEREEGL